MKEISTIAKDPKETQDLFENLMGVKGNNEIRQGHITYFENKILEYRENTTNDIVLAPNYHAWLWLMSEHVFWRMKRFCFTQDELKEDNLDLQYNKLVEKFCEKCRSLESCSHTDIPMLFERAVKALDIRHAIVHRGFPNVLPATFGKGLNEKGQKKKGRKKPVCSTGDEPAEFVLEETQEAISWYSNPKHFEDIRTEFQSLIEVMSKGPGLTVYF